MKVIIFFFCLFLIAGCCSTRNGQLGFRYLITPCETDSNLVNINHYAFITPKGKADVTFRYLWHYCVLPDSLEIYKQRFEQETKKQFTLEMERQEKINKLNRELNQ